MNRSKDRRREARLNIERPVKLQCQVTGRYVSGTTTNLSNSGMLIVIEHPSLLVPGQRVKVGVQQTRQNVVIKANEMATATVVRSLGMRGRQTVAVQFDQRQRLSRSA